MPEPQIPHLALPLRFIDGVPVLVDQDSPEHVADRILACARTERTHCDDDPMFGVPQQVMRTNGVDLAVLHTALADCEPEHAPEITRITDIRDLRRDTLIGLLTDEDPNG